LIKRRGADVKKILLALTAVTALTTSSAFAADIPPPVYKGPPPQPSYNWTGCYVGAGGGYGMYRVDHVSESVTTGLPLTLRTTAGGSGGLATVQVGCDYQFSSSLLIGAFADWDWRGLTGEYTDVITGFNSMTGTLRQRWSWAAGARVGYLVTPSLLTYFDAGFVSTRYGQVDFFGGSFNSPPGIGLSNGLQIAAQTFNGWFVGGGTEFAISAFPGLFWKTEYRFADYQTKTAAIVCVNPAATGLCALGAPQFNDRMHPKDHTVRTELVWRFGGGAVRAAY
jgi:outer membrane immunogenic protein